MGLSRTGASENRHTTQSLQNQSFDREFGVLAVENLSFNPLSGTLERVSGLQGNGSLVLGYDGDGNLTSIEKTIGSTTYTKTLSYTGSRLTGITTWST